MGFDPAQELVVYVDVEGPLSCPFPGLEPRVTVCGYYGVADLEEQAGVPVITLGGSWDP